MVMHARKHPRIDDGYYDCHEYQELKSSNCDRKLARDRRIRDDQGLTNDRHGSPTYRHKNITNDRRKLDKDRYGKYYEEDDHAEELRFADKNNSNCADRSTNYMSDRRSGDSRVDAKTNNSRAKVRELASKSEDVKRASSAKSNSTGSTKDPRIEAQKTALRVCGDWSEHVSSSGKKYFYNCKTEVSQWVKPKEWKADELAKQERLKASTGATKSVEESCVNGISSHNERLGSPSASEKGAEDSRRNTDNDSRPRVSSKSYPRTHSGIHRNSSQHEQTSTKDINIHQTLHRNNDRSSSVTSTPSSSVMDTTCASPGSGVHVDRTVSSDRLHSQNGINDGSSDDMDISPEGSPKPLMDCSQNINTDQQSGLSNKLTARRQEVQQSSNSDQSMIWGKALQTLQTLQEVLERTRGAPNQNGGNTLRTAADSPRSATSQSSPRVTSHPAQPQQATNDVTESLSSVPADKSPTVSEASLGQHSALSSTTESSSTSNILLPQSLINYYDPSLLGHISDWPAEQIELRAHMAYRDGLVICGHHCGQVSTELKRDRSQVRIAEVQSTLIEHRILFLKQQISELETQDKSYSSQT